MNEISIKSFSFRNEREASWQELDDMITKAEKSGVKSLNVQEMRKLPALYRATLSSLSVARTISLDKALLRYLENLSARAFFIVYGPRKNLLESVKEFFVVNFPASVRRARWTIMIAALTMMIGFAVGFYPTMSNSDWYYSFMPDEMIHDRSPAASAESLRAGLYEFDDRKLERLKVFAAFLFSHNAKVGMLAFALGFAFGIPVFVLMFYNGAILGAFVALYTSKGLGVDIWGWILIHGSTEILAVILCGGAGLVLGQAVIFPGQNSRMQNLARHGRSASVIIMGAVLLFFVAGFLEAFARQLVTDLSDRFLIAGVMFLFWMTYILFSGRRRDHGNDR